MEYPISFPGFEGRQLLVQTAGFFSGPKLMIDGRRASAGPKRGQLVLHRNDGSEVIAQLHTIFIDPVPQLILNGQRITLAEPLKWYQWLWMALPIALVFVGGLLGGLCGALAFIINARIFRSNLHGFAKYILTGVISVGSLVAYFILAVLFSLAIGGG